MAWNFEYCPTANDTQDLGGTQANSLQCMVWPTTTWNEIKQINIRNAWRISNFRFGFECKNCNYFYKRIKSQINGGVLELEKLIACSNLGNTWNDKLVENLRTSNCLDMVDENITSWIFITKDCSFDTKQWSHENWSHVASNDEHLV